MKAGVDSFREDVVHPSAVVDSECTLAEGCITCGDVADPMRVLKIDAERELALCEAQGGSHHTVEIALVQPVAEGESVLVHAGTAIANLGAEEAVSR